MKIKGKELMLNKKKTTTKKRKQILKARALFLCLKTYFKKLIYIFIKKNLEENVEPNDRFSSLLKFFFFKDRLCKTRRQIHSLSSVLELHNSETRGARRRMS